MSEVEFYFSADLKTSRGIANGPLMPFDSLEALCCDIYASMPETAMDLLREGIDPMSASYLIRDAQGRPMLEIGFTELVRGHGSSGAASVDDDWTQATNDLRARSAAAIDRIDRATAWMADISARAAAIGNR